MKKKLFTIFSWSVVVSMMIIVLVGSYWLFFPYRVIEFKDNVFPIVNANKTVKSGEQLIYLARSCKYMNVSVTVSRQFVDGIIYSLPKVESNLPLGCKDNLVYVQVPTAIPAGKVTMSILYQIHVNPIRKIELTQTTEQFTVIK
jgi:hypothetical protein